MANVSSLSFINDDGIREKRNIVDAGARTLIQSQEAKIAALEDVDENFEGGPILLNMYQANGLYEGRNISTVFESEIANGYANVWEYLADRVDLAATAGKAAYKGLRLRDYAEVQVESNTYRYRIGAFDYDKGCGDPAQGPSLLMVPNLAFPDRVKWNNTDDNNGTAAQNFPYLASNVYNWLTNTLLPKFPAEVRAVMKERVALIEQRYSASSKLTDSTSWAWKNIGRLWLPDEGEMYGCCFWGSKYGSAMVSQFPIFETPADRIFRTPDGARSNVWLRCVSGLSSAAACYSNANGYASRNICSWDGCGVAPCFTYGLS